MNSVQEFDRLSGMLKSGLASLTELGIVADTAILLAIKDLYSDATIVDVNNKSISQASLDTVRKGFIVRRPTRLAGRESKKSRFAMIMADYPIRSFSIDFLDPSGFDELDRTDVFLDPFDRHDPRMTDEIWRRISTRAAKETKPGGISNLSIACWSLRMALGWFNYNNIPMQYLSFYIKWHNGLEPFIIAKQGNEVSQISRDSVAALRVYTLLEAAMFYESYKDVLPDAWWLEVLPFILSNPSRNAKVFRGLTTLALQAVGSIVPIGSCKIIKYHAIDERESFPVPSDYTIVDCDFNDAVFYNVYKR